MDNIINERRRSHGPTIAILPPLPESEEVINSGSTPSAQQQSQQQQTQPIIPTQQHYEQQQQPINSDISSPRLSSQWTSDSQSNYCNACQSKFDGFLNRKHHCRLCGLVFCNNCSNTRSLIPPSALVLRETSNNTWLDLQTGQRLTNPSFASNSNEVDSSITYVNQSNSNDDTLLYGKGLEQRMLKARHPQRTCHACAQQLAPIQNELCLRNSNAMRYNFIDEGDAVRRLINSPLAFTLGHEVRKAAYALTNLLPRSKNKRGGFVPTSDRLQYSYPPPESDPCYIPNGGGCKNIDPTLSNLDRLHIPAKLLQQAKGIAIVTSAKGGLGFAGFEFGTGLVVARRNDGSSQFDNWTAPCAIGIGGFAWGALIGAQVSDHVFLLMTEDAVRLFSSEKGRSIQLGADIGVALGPLGRSAEADLGASSLSRTLDGTNRVGPTIAPIYTYSLSKGLYAGLSLDGRILMTRDRVNEKFYGRTISAYEILSGQVPSPPAAQPLYDALKRCRVYGGGSGNTGLGGQMSMSEGIDDGGYNVHNSGGGGLMVRLSHTTGAGLPISATNAPSRYSTSPNRYNLAGREENLTPGYD